MGEHTQGTFQCIGGIELYYQCWHPPASPKGILTIIHGLGGHSGLFKHIIDYFLPLNYKIYACDLPGHGRSPGQRGYIKSWDEFRGDIDAFLSLIKQQNPHCPCFLYGNSLGGVIVLDYGLSYPEKIQGVIAAGAPLGRVGISPFKLFIGQILSRVWPRFSLDTGIPLEAGSRDQKAIESYLNDSLRHRKGTARLATELFTTVEKIQNNASNLKVPLLILHGEKDPVSLPEGVHTFFNHVTFADKTFIEYPEALHDLHNELNYPEIMADLATWLENHRQ
ncbi:alpha/beta hydrolase fold protein [Gloeothece citriformis PCC 7424]|uniref:Monoacylglycerol lipase n=1 Tax=Gloeothece citriformis (strain PCC 7424) TaxID=65393 RepID=B7KHX5_GLOC7|nr:alpha/beta hydrolase [Gloeothece citriformis]ACK72072.1 alpha/beta hydrolase fold protein [Gloeothece citriformis PCC 7424]